MLRVLFVTRERRFRVERLGLFDPTAAQQPFPIIKHASLSGGDAREGLLQVDLGAVVIQRHYVDGDQGTGGPQLGCAREAILRDGFARAQPIDVSDREGLGEQV